MARPKKSKRFKYNLESVLKVRAIREQQEQEKFNEAQKKLEEEKQKEKELKDFQAQKYEEMRQMMSDGSTISDVQNIQMRRGHLDVVKEQVADQVKVREEAALKKEEQRENLVKAVKEKKIIEKDKENKRWQWKKFMDKEEGKFLDDISSVGFVKKKREDEDSEPE